MTNRSADSLDTLTGAIDAWLNLLNASADAGADAAAAILEAATRATTRYTNDTGATRAGTVAYVAGRQDAQATAAKAAGERLHPGTSVETTVAREGDERDPTVVLTVFQTYDDPLEARTAFISHAFETAQGEAADAALRRIADAF